MTSKASLSRELDATAGASAGAIQAHYDVGNSFFSLWLDSSMTYSCALWEGTDTLEAAQLRKLDFHIDQARAAGAGRVLDVGCGWGSLMTRLANRGAQDVVGLTLSPAQASYIRHRKVPSLSVLEEGWQSHVPSAPYDAVISVGALEHFVRPEMSPAERVGIYRDFFSRCGDWLHTGGLMSVQTIAYGNGNFRHGTISSIFPESDLPRLGELVSALEGRFELVRLRNDREDYARTCRSWLERLRSSREHAIRVVGTETVEHYESFLGASARGFDAGVFLLLRLQLRRLDR